MVNSRNSIDCFKFCACSARTVLPFAIPESVTYNYIAFVQGIALASTPHSAFIVNNYIQLSSTSICTHSHKLAFYPQFGLDQCPSLGFGISESLAPTSVAEFKQLIERSISAGSYIRLVLDEFYLPSRVAYRKRHYTHDCLIIGYCPSCELCLMAGYHRDPSVPDSISGVGKFGLQASSIDDVSTSFFTERHGGFTDSGIRECLKFTPKRFSIALNHNFIGAQITDYLEGRRNESQFAQLGFPTEAISNWPSVSSQVRFGIDIYDEMSRLLAEHLRVNGKRYFWRSARLLDLRTLSLLLDHKVLMVSRLTRMQRERSDQAMNDAIESAKECVAVAATVKLLAIAVRAKPEKQRIARMLTLLSEMKRIELTYLPRLLK